MALLRNLSKSPNKNFDLLQEKRRIIVKKNALVRLKYIHSRILDHIKMRKFLENHEVDTYLNQLGKLITNIDEVEAFRKRVKTMLLTIKDSIVEFGEAVSSGEITFPSGNISETYNMISKKSSQSSSGVSTSGEISSLSSFALTNNNFQTLPNNNPEEELIQSKPPTESILVAQYDKDYISSKNSNRALSSSLMNRGFHSVPNSCSVDGSEIKRGGITHRLQNEAYSISLLENKLTESQKGEMFTSYGAKNISVNNASINLSSLALTNHNFQTFTNSCRINTIPGKTADRDKERSQGEGAISEDLFTQPIQVAKNIKFKKRLDNHIANKNIGKKSIAKFSSNHQEHTRSENVSTLNTNSKFEIKNYDFINNLKQLTLGTPNNTGGLFSSSQSLETNESKNSKVKLINTPIVEEESSSFDHDTDSGATSEIFILDDNTRNIGNGEYERESNNFVIKNRSYEIDNENNHNKISQGYKDFTKKQSIIVSTKSNQNSQAYCSQNSQQMNHQEETRKAKHHTETVSENVNSFYHNFSQISQSQDVCDPLTTNYRKTDNNRGIKRRVMDVSSNLEMINGNIVNICSSVGSCPITCADRSNVISDTRIRCSRDTYDLDKELEDAKEECSRTLNDLTNLLNETKKELLESKNTSASEYCNGKLKFPPGYEHHYKHLDDLLLDFKTNIGLPRNIYQDKDQNLFFEEAMNDWKKLQQIVQKIKKCEKIYKGNNLDIKYDIIMNVLYE